MKHLLIALIIPFVLIGCGEKKLKPNAKFHLGEIVKSVLDEQQGQITRVACWTSKRICRYEVRFKSSQGHKWGKAYSAVFMKEFEIKKAR
jgi:hypothetical protein